MLLLRGVMIPSYLRILILAAREIRGAAHSQALRFPGKKWVENEQSQGSTLSVLDIRSGWLCVRAGACTVKLAIATYPQL